MGGTMWIRSAKLKIEWATQPKFYQKMRSRQSATRWARWCEFLAQSFYATMFPCRAGTSWNVMSDFSKSFQGLYHICSAVKLSACQLHSGRPIAWNQSKDKSGFGGDRCHSSSCCHVTRTAFLVFSFDVGIRIRTLHASEIRNR